MQAAFALFSAWDPSHIRLMAKNPNSPKNPRKNPKSKAHRPDVQPIGPALAELLNPAINRGEAGIGSTTGARSAKENTPLPDLESELRSPRTPQGGREKNRACGRRRTIRATGAPVAGRRPSCARIDPTALGEVTQSRRYRDSRILFRPSSPELSAWSGIGSRRGWGMLLHASPTGGGSRDARSLPPLTARRTHAPALRAGAGREPRGRQIRHPRRPR